MHLRVFSPHDFRSVVNEHSRKYNFEAARFVRRMKTPDSIKARAAFCDQHTDEYFSNGSASNLEEYRLRAHHSANPHIDRTSCFYRGRQRRILVNFDDDAFGCEGDGCHHR